jgi:rfaE bifunctional protein kinase chain/domain
VVLEIQLADREILEIRDKAPTGRIVFVSGNFNIVHPGHLRLLKFGAEVGDFLVVGVTPDGGANVTVPSAMRLEAIRAISLVGHAFVLHEPPDEFVRRLQPHAVVKGKEYQSCYNPEESAVASYGGKLLFSSGEAQFSSVHLLQREYFESSLSNIRMPVDYPDRHGFRISDLKSVVNTFTGLRVLVVGDLILDEYISCDPVGMSQEDPTIVVIPIESKMFMGGAGIVAAHAHGVGAQVSFVTVVGDDERAHFAREYLQDLGVEAHVFVDETRPTSLKQRFRAMGKTLLRINHLRQHAVSPTIADCMLARVEELLETTDLILFSDFNYGCLPQRIIDGISEVADRLGVMIAADSQASSQLSDISRFKGARLVTPTEREARLALRDSDSGLAVLAEQLQKRAHAENVIVTLGAEGLLLHAKKGDAYQTDRLPAFNTAPIDVAGAGDSFFACVSLGVCAGFDIWRCAYLGAIAAACQVSRVGNTPLTMHDLINEIDRSTRWYAA